MNKTSSHLLVVYDDSFKSIRLIEEEVYQSFDISRQAVRAALLQLEKDKLIIRKSRNRAVVSFIIREFQDKS